MMFDANEYIDLAVATTAVVSGIGLFVGGFAAVRRNRLLTALPVSRIRSAAMGLVKIRGRAAALGDLVAPIVAEPCVHYSITCKEGEGEDERRLCTMDSGDRPFLVSDVTGPAVVRPQGALIATNRVSVRTFRQEADVPADVLKLLETHSRRGGPKRWPVFVRVSTVVDGDPLLIIGDASAQRLQGPLAERFAEASARRATERASSGSDSSRYARRLKASPDRMAALDLDGDGRVDETEWQAGLDAYAAEQDAASLQAGGTGASPGTTMIISRPQDARTPFTIDVGREADVVSGTASRATWGFVLGPILMLAGGAWLVYRFSGLWGLR